MKQVIETKEAPAAIGPYSQAIRSGQLLFISGQIPVDPASGEVVNGGIVQQTRQVLLNLEAILRTQGLDAAAVLKTTVFLQDLADFQAVNEVYGGFFHTAAPARSCVQVVALPKGVLVEIEAIAAV